MAFELAEGGADGAPPMARTHELAATPGRTAAGRPVARALVLAHCTCARRDPGGTPGLLEAAGGLVGARSGRYSTGPCSPVAKGAASVSNSFGEGGGAHRGVSALINSIWICITFGVTIRARVPVYH